MPMRSQCNAHSLVSWSPHGRGRTHFAPPCSNRRASRAVHWQTSGLVR
jgi:hypothetical protein